MNPRARNVVLERRKAAASHHTIPAPDPPEPQPQSNTPPYAPEEVAVPDEDQLRHAQEEEEEERKSLVAPGSTPEASNAAQQPHTYEEDNIDDVPNELAEKTAESSHDRLPKPSQNPAPKVEATAKDGVLPSDWKVAYVSLAMDAFHAEMATVMMDSMRTANHFKSPAHRIVFHFPDHPEESLNLMRSHGIRPVETSTVPLSPKTVEFIRLVQKRKGVDPNKTLAGFAKLRAWMLAYYDRIIWIDPDVLVYQPLDPLFAMGSELLLIANPLAPELLVQGGLVMLKPNHVVFELFEALIASVDNEPQAVSQLHALAAAAGIDMDNYDVSELREALSIGDYGLLSYLFHTLKFMKHKSTVFPATAFPSHGQYCRAHSKGNPKDSGALAVYLNEDHDNFARAMASGAGLASNVNADACETRIFDQWLQFYKFIRWQDVQRAMGNTSAPTVKDIYVAPPKVPPVKPIVTTAPAPGSVNHTRSWSTASTPTWSGPHYAANELFWFVSAWTTCSKTCGEGTQTREVHCTHKVYPPRSYDDAMCLSHKGFEAKPPLQKTCQVKPC